MLQNVTPDFIASAIVGLLFLLSGIGVYVRTRTTTPKIEGAFRVTSEESAIVAQLKRIADALEEANDDETREFQTEMRERFRRLDEASAYRQHGRLPAQD